MLTGKRIKKCSTISECLNFIRKITGMFSLTFRQVQCDFARGQSEIVEDCALEITIFFNKIKLLISLNKIRNTIWC